MSKRTRATAIAGSLLLAVTSASGVLASSHREAPLIAGDPSADNTDLYAFVSPDDPSTVTIIANYIPLEEPGRRPELQRVRPRRAVRDPHRQQRRRQRRHHLPVPLQDQAESGQNGVSSFLYNNGPITSLTDHNCSPARTFSVTQVDQRRVQGRSAMTSRPSPANIGPRSTPNYADLAAAASSRSATAQGLRRSARRPVLRRPGLDLRSGRPAPVQRRAPAPARPRHRRRRRRRLQHQHHRPPGARSRELRQSASQPVDRGLGEREPHGGPSPRRRTARPPASAPGSRSRGWAIR